MNLVLRRGGPIAKLKQMKLKTAIMCGVLIIMALFFGAMLKGPLPVAIAGVGVVAWVGFVLGLYAVVFKPSRLRVVDPDDWNEQVQLMTIDVTGHVVIGDVVSLRSACDWKVEQDKQQPHVTHTWRFLERGAQPPVTPIARSKQP